MKRKHNLLEKMADYKYGSYNMKNVEFENNAGVVKIKGFYSGLGKVGVCNEQNEFYVRKNNDLDLIRVVGTEPKYFNSKKDTHYFSVQPIKTLPDNFDMYSPSVKKAILVDMNPRVVDASMKVVCNLKDSGYSINSVLDRFPLFENAVFKEGSLKPLGVNSNGELLYLGLQDGNFKVFNQRPGKCSLEGSIPLESLFEMAPLVKGDVELGSLISRLSEAYTDFKFKK